LSELNRTSSESPSLVARVNVSASFTELTLPVQRAHLLASLTVYLRRAASGSEQVRLSMLVASMPDDADKFYSRVVPVVISAGEEETYENLVQRTANELTEVESRLTFARDIFLRYPELRGQAAYEQELPVLVSRGQADAPLQGICLNLD